MRLICVYFLLTLSFSALAVPSAIVKSIRAASQALVKTPEQQVGRLSIKVGVLGFKSKDLLFQMETKKGTDILLFLSNSKKNLTLVRLTPIMAHREYRNSSRVLREARRARANLVDKKLQRVINSNLEDSGVNAEVKSNPFMNLDLGDTTNVQYDLSSYHFDEATLRELDASFFEKLLNDVSEL